MYKVLTLNHLTFGDKGVRVLGLHNWSHLQEILVTKSSLQTLERSLDGWFRPRWFFLLKLSKNKA